MIERLGTINGLLGRLAESNRESESRTMTERARSGKASLFRAMALAAIIAACAGRAEANAIPSVRPLSYTVSGSIGQAGVEGRDVIRFTGVQDGTLYDWNSQTGQFNFAAAGPQSLFFFNLGTFHVDALSDGEITRYTDTPVALTLHVEGSPPIVLNGVLNAAIDGSDTTDVKASLDRGTFREIPNIWSATLPNSLALPIETGGFVSLLLGDRPLIESTPWWPTDGPRSIQVGTALFPVPEPASLSVFLGLSAGFVLRRRSRGR